ERPDGPPPERTWTTRQLLAYGVPLSATQIVGKLNVQIDKYMIAALCTAEIFAVYTVGATEMPLVPGIAYAVTGALLPVLVVRHAEGDRDGFLEYWHGSMVKVALLMMPVFVFLFLTAEPVVRVLFSARYVDATVPFRAYLCLLPLRLCAYGAVVRALGTTRPILVAALVALGVNAGLNYPLYLAFGLVGPAAASVIAQLASIAVLLTTVRRELGIGWGAVFPWKAALRPLAVAAIAGVPLYFLGDHLTGNLLPFAVGLPVFAAVYLGLALALGLLGRADLVYAMQFATLRLGRKKR
ncbi:MAG: polysaccharide biosynthesis C-terminal domain-containing protein, partial [Myxococcales bacterium]|nr:polysaccharide biosynthesis C-terminal domain-containing protein [Myxococcales bacterium]